DIADIKTGDERAIGGEVSQGVFHAAGVVDAIIGRGPGGAAALAGPEAGEQVEVEADLLETARNIDPGLLQAETQGDGGAADQEHQERAHHQTADHTAALLPPRRRLVGGGAVAVAVRIFEAAEVETLVRGRRLLDHSRPAARVPRHA